MNAQLPALLDNVASRQDPITETHRFSRGYGLDPVNNKATVELTIDFVRCHISVTPLPFLTTERDWQERYSRREQTYGQEFGFVEGKDPEKWGAIVRLIADAMQFGTEQLVKHNMPKKEE